VKLPSIQIDAIAESTSDGVDRLIANRNPQPDEVQVGLRRLIAFDHITLEGIIPAREQFTVSVGGAVIFVGSDLEEPYRYGWTGYNDGDNDDAIPGVRRFVFYPPSDYESGARVDVLVEVTGDAPVSWSFVAYDYAAPLIVEALAIDAMRVRVTFGEPVSMVSAALEGDALNPDSYVIERSTRPAATPQVTSVERLSDSSVVLTTSFELTFGAGYMLVVSDIADEFGNQITPPNNVFEFIGYLPPWPAGRRFLLHNFVPAYTLAADTSGDLRLFLGCLQDGLNLLLYSVDRWAEILDPEHAPESFLDAMLQDLGNPFDFELDVTDKRKLAKLLVRIYQLKGTQKGIRDVVRFFLGIEVTIEIFNGIGWRLGYDRLSSKAAVAEPNPIVIGAGSRARYSFRVRSDQILTAEQRSRIHTIATYMKGAPEHLVGVRDGSPVVIRPDFWTLGITQLGYAALSDGVPDVPSDVPLGALLYDDGSALLDDADGVSFLMDG